MDTAKIKIRIGDHEFEAEGPAEVVKSQFEAFKELIAMQPRPILLPQPVAEQQLPQDQAQAIAQSTMQLDKIFKVEGRIVSLTAHAGSPDDATLLLMLGQKQFRGNDAVTGQELGDGLEHSGIRVQRVDRIMDKFVKEGLVLKIGLGRATRYRLTNPGMAKSTAVAKELLGNLP
ncbi:MAG TPA: hypothetical protein VFB79_23050 [Candidatus Angelobacter sp.]|nr:hypothetical protein [Candidatus Angelobacter sp.]